MNDLQDQKPETRRALAVLVFTQMVRIYGHG